MHRYYHINVFSIIHLGVIYFPYATVNEAQFLDNLFTLLLTLPAATAVTDIVPSTNIYASL